MPKDASPGPADRAGPGLPSKKESALELLPEYREWLTRLDMTYESVVNCCASRLRDRTLGEAAGLTILIGLLSRPRVFQYYGLPYSGRIAHLAEPEIARLNKLRPSSPAEGPAGIQRWHQIRERLNSVPARQQAVFVRACVDGYSGKQLAEALGCDEQDAAARADEVMRMIEEIGEQSA